MIQKTQWVLVFFLLFAVVRSQTPAYAWEKSFTGAGDDCGFDICTDKKGSVYITGYFKSATLVLGTYTLTNTSTNGRSDVFIARCDTSGTILWARKAGGTNDDVGYKVACDVSGNAYVTGYFKSATATFGSVVLTNAYATAGDVFIVKYDPSGNVLWAHRAGYGNDDEGMNVATDQNKNVYVTGYYYSTKIIFGNDTLLNAGLTDYFLVKYDSAGTEQWARKVGGTDYEEGYGLAVDGNNNVYVLGDFCSFMDVFGPDTLYNVNAGSNDIFLVKYAPSGNVIWAKSANGPFNDNSWRVNLDPQGNVIIAGTLTSSSLVFDTITVIGPPGSFPPADLFIAKYDSSGHVLWAHSNGGPDVDVTQGLTVDNAGNAIINGMFMSGTLSFGSFNLQNKGYAGIGDIFIAKYDPSGNVTWAAGLGDSLSDGGTGVDADANGDIYFTGCFSKNHICFNSDTLFNTGGADVFLAKIPGAVNAVNYFEEKEDVSFFPNPTNGKLLIETGLSITELKVANLVGQQMPGMIPIHYEKAVVLDLSDLAAGIYFITLKTSEGIITRKIIKQ